MLPEYFAEIAEAAEAHGCRDLGYGPVTASQQKFRLLDAVNAQIILETAVLDTNAVIIGLYSEKA